MSTDRSLEPSTGPIMILLEEHRCDVQLPHFGAAIVRVKQSNGSAAAYPEVSVRQEDPLPDFPGWSGPRRTDADGFLRWGMLAPGTYVLCSFRTQQKMASTTFEVRPGQTTDVEVRLPP
jgi:hypothetical protein